MACIEFLHDRRAGKAANHHPAPQQAEIIACLLMGQIGDIGLADEIDEQVGDADFRDQIDEDGRDAEHQIAMHPERVLLALFLAVTRCRIAHGGQGEAGDDDRQNHQYDRDDDIGQDHRLRVGQPFGLGQDDIALRRATLRPAQDQIGAKERGEHRARRVHRLHQIEARGSGFRLANDRDIGVGRDLQQGDAAGDDEQHDQRHAIGGDGRRQRHARCARRHDQQPDDHRLLIADAFDQFGRRDGGEEIGDEPDRFDQRRLGVAQVEHAAQMRQQRVVDDRDEAPHEKQAGQQP